MERLSRGAICRFPFQPALRTLRVDLSLVEDLTPPVLSLTLLDFTFNLRIWPILGSLMCRFQCQLIRWESLDPGLNSRLIDGITGVAEKWKTGYCDRS